jgi:hypothetical protein
VDRRHQALLDAPALLDQDVDHRRQAVGRATGVGDDVVPGRVILVVVDPLTMVMSSFLAGAEMITFRAPAVMWPVAFSASVNRPVDSITYSTPSCFHGRAAGPSLIDRHLIL